MPDDAWRCDQCITAGGMAKQPTVRGFDDEPAKHICGLAKRDGISLNQAALKPLRKGAGLADPARGAETVGSSLDFLMSTLTNDEAAQMDEAPEAIEELDVI